MLALALAVSFLENAHMESGKWWTRCKILKKKWWTPLRQDMGWHWGRYGGIPQIAQRDPDYNSEINRLNGTSLLSFRISGKIFVGYNCDTRVVLGSCLGDTCVIPMRCLGDKWMILT